MEETKRKRRWQFELRDILYVMLAVGAFLAGRISMSNENEELQLKLQSARTRATVWEEQYERVAAVKAKLEYERQEPIKAKLGGERR